MSTLDPRVAPAVLELHAAGMDFDEAVARFKCTGRLPLFEPLTPDEEVYFDAGWKAGRLFRRLEPSYALFGRWWRSHGGAR